MDPRESRSRARLFGLVNDEVRELQLGAPGLPVPEMRIENIAAIRCSVDALSDETAACVEVGTYKGGSLRYLLHRLGAVNKSLPIFCVDREITADAVAVGDALDVGSAVTFVRGESHAVAAEWQRPVQYLLIDATHVYEEVARDLRLWTPFVIPGGCILCHDYEPTAFPGTVRAVDEFASRHALAIDNWSGMAVMQVPRGVRAVAHGLTEPAATIGR